MMMVVATINVTAQYPVPRSYTVLKTNKPLKVDGKLDDNAWKKSEWSSSFVDISDTINPNPPLKTQFKMLWDERYLYIAAKLEEPHLWATLKDRDAIIYRDHDFEVFIDPNNDAREYFEIEINAFGTVMDLFMPKPYKKGGKADLSWNATGLLSAVHTEGTLNNHRDTDQFWTVEMAIPFENLVRDGRVSHPAVGSTWRINFSRVQWTLEHTGTGYAPKKRENGKRIPENNWVWSPQGIIDMHVPERWGYLHFSN
jgi:hypothetical protein